MPTDTVPSDQQLIMKMNSFPCFDKYNVVC